MSTWLGIDGALGAFSAAVVSDDGAAERVAVGSGKDALERGLRLIDEALGDVQLASLDGIAVTIGPGSFTGLRIALGYAKSLAFAAGIPLAGISSYDALAEPATNDFDARAEIVHGRVGFACMRLHVASQTTIACGAYDALAEHALARLGGRKLALAAGAPAGVVSACSERGIIVHVSTAQPVVPAVAVARFALAGRANAGSPHAVRADYGEQAYYERPGAPSA